MPVLLDTNVVVRYFTGDPLEMAQRARALIEGDTVIVLSGVVIAEVAHVMQRVYRVDREMLLVGLRGLLTRRNVRVIDAELDTVVEALELCRGSNRVSVADALVWATAIARELPVATFDRRFPPDRVHVYEPA